MDIRTRIGIGIMAATMTLFAVFVLLTLLLIGMVIVAL